MRVPQLETKRLILRGHRKEDFAALAAMWAEPAVWQHILGGPATLEESWSRLLRYAGHWAMLGYGFWVAEEKASTSFVGEMGFADYRRDIDPPFGKRPEVGWGLASRYHGMGYASEALTAIMAWGDAHFGSLETACMIAPQNLASIRVAEKLGFQETLRTSYKGQPEIVFYRRPPV